MMSMALFLLMVTVAGPVSSFPQQYNVMAELALREDNGYISIKDLGTLLSSMCEQLSVFKETLASGETFGYGEEILKTRLPLPNLRGLDFAGIIDIVTKGLGMALDKVTETVGANAPPPGSTAVATPDPNVKQGFLLTVGDIVDIANYLCKVVNLVAALLNNKLFDALGLNLITIPLRDPRQPLPNLSWIDKLDILNLQGLTKGIYNAGANLVSSITCLWNCPEVTTAAPESLKPEKPAILDALADYLS